MTEEKNEVILGEASIGIDRRQGEWWVTLNGRGLTQLLVSWSCPTYFNVQRRVVYAPTHYLAVQEFWKHFRDTVMCALRGESTVTVKHPNEGEWWLRLVEHDDPRYVTSPDGEPLRVTYLELDGTKTEVGDYTLVKALADKIKTRLEK